MAAINEAGDNITVSNYRQGEPDSFPKELLDSLIALGSSRYRLDDAIWFYQTTRNAVSFRWVEAKELLELDNTSKYEVHYYESNWEDSCWSFFDRPLKFVGTPEDPTRGGNGRNGSIIADFGFYADGEENLGNWTLLYDEQVLLVELSAEEIAARVEQDRKKDEADKAEMVSPEEALLRDLFNKPKE